MGESGVLDRSPKRGKKRSQEKLADSQKVVREKGILVGKRTTKGKERLSSKVHRISEEVKEDKREVKVTVKIDSSERETKRDYPKSNPESIRLPPRVGNMEKENAIASGKNDRSDNDCLHSGLFPESPESQRNIQVMKPGDGSYLESSNATIVSNTQQELVERNNFHLSHKHLPVNKCTETVNIEIVSDGKPERLASTVQDCSENHSGIKSSIIIHPKESPLNHMKAKYVRLENIYHQDPSYSALSPLLTNMAIIPGNEHSGNVKKCTSSLSPVPSAPDIPSDILVLESKDARSDYAEKGWWLWIFADGWTDIWMWLEYLLHEIFPPAQGIQEETPDSPKERCSHNLKNKS